jgi:hypothetical protein
MMSVEITQKKNPKDATVTAKVDKDLDLEIKRITFAIGQSRSLFLQDAIVDRLIYLRGYLNDKEDGYV